MVNKFIQSLTQNQTVDLIRSVTDQLEKTLGITIDNNARVEVLISMRKEVEAERKKAHLCQATTKAGFLCEKTVTKENRNFCRLHLPSHKPISDKLVEKKDL